MNNLSKCDNIGQTIRTTNVHGKHPTRLSNLNDRTNSDSSSSTGGRDINYCEVYYLSPPTCELQDYPKKAHVNLNKNQWPSLQSNHITTSHTQYPENILLGNLYPIRSYDTNFDNLETRSHFSDSAASVPQKFQLARNRNVNVTFSNHDEEKIHINHGSFRRNKNKSSQSLCSCDADTEIFPNPNSNQPLYKYNLDRNNKLHTYTCEQNAQILMRLEKERRLTGLGIYTDKKDDEIKGIIKGPTQKTSLKDVSSICVNQCNSLESDSTTDVDIIPPPPPPVSFHKRKTFYSEDALKGYTNNGELYESMLNDCTATILNCANSGYVGTIKPDLCNLGKQQTEIDKSHINQENIPLSSYPYIKDDTYLPCFKSKRENPLFIYHQNSPQYEPNNENRSNYGKYNTIGPSNFSTKQFSNNQKILCNGKINGNYNVNNLTNGRYFSQSLSNFALVNQHEQDTSYHWNNGSHINDFTGIPYTQCRTPTSSLSCNFGDGTLIDTSYTTITGSNGTLKGKLHHQTTRSQQSSSNLLWKHRQCPSRGSSSSGTTSIKMDPSKHWLAVSSILLIVGAASVAVPLALRVAASAPFEERLRAATQLLDEVPLIDGHNDLPWNIRKFLHNKLNEFSFDEDLRNVMPWARSHWSHTDLQRLKKGRVAAQFWAAYVPCEAQHRDAVQLTLEQIDIIKRLTERYSPQLVTCTSVTDIIEAHKNHQICSLTGVEGGHSLGGSLAVLRTLYGIGVRYMTLTSTCHTPWADSSQADSPKYDVKHGGLTTFGKTIIHEMNRLGMIVDLSHVSTGTMRDALATTDAPVIFSHSSAFELCNSSRNVQDDILQLVAQNGGLVMVNFYSKFLTCSENSTVHDAVAHINHIKRVAGIDHVGLGAGFDGINFTPKGLEDVSTYPTLFAELLGEGWSIEELTKLAGQNFLRVMSEVEKIRDNKKLSGIKPYEDHPSFRSENPYNCSSS